MTDRYAHLRGSPVRDHPLIAALSARAQRMRVGMPDCCTDAEVVYLVTGGGRVKIGTSRDMGRRIVDLQVGSPVDLKIIALTYGGIAFEQQLHGICSEHRIYGEWFDLDGVKSVLRSAFADAKLFDECLRCAIAGDVARRTLRAAVKAQAANYRPRLKPVRRRFDSTLPRDPTP